MEDHDPQDARKTQLHIPSSPGGPIILSNSHSQATQHPARLEDIVTLYKKHTLLPTNHFGHQTLDKPQQTFLLLSWHPTVHSRRVILTLRLTVSRVRSNYCCGSWEEEELSHISAYYMSYIHNWSAAHGPTLG